VAHDYTSPPPGAVSLGRERLVLLCDSETARRAGKAPCAEWINSSRIIYVQGRMQLLDTWARTEGIEISPREAGRKADHVAAALEITASAGGVTAAISTYAGVYLETGRLVAPFGAGQLLPLALHVVPNPHRRLTQAASDFMQWLEKEIGAIGS